MPMSNRKQKLNMAIERPPASASYREQWRRSPLRRMSLVVLPIREKAVQRRNIPDLVRAEMRGLAARLTSEHPAISTDPGIYGGNPHINNVRLTVGNILGKLHNYGSIQAVADIYAPHVNESQIKEAIAYAQDFLEEAIHAGEPS